MYSKENIIETITQNGQYIDAFMLDAFIKNWKIEAIYEDENGVEFFDDEAIEKIKSNIAPKTYADSFAPIEIENNNIEETPSEQIEETVIEESNVEVIEKIPNETSEPFFEEKQAQIEQTEQVVSEEIQPLVQTCDAVQRNYNEGEIKNVTLDITNQTLGVLAESIAQKITSDIAKFIKDTDFIEQAINVGSFKKDNEILAKKIQEIIDDNKILVKKIQELQQERDAYLKVFGNIYVKKSLK